MLDIMLEGDQDLVDYQCHQVPGAQYKRVNPVLPFTIGLGDVRPIAMAWIRQNFLMIREER